MSTSSMSIMRSIIFSTPSSPIRLINAVRQNQALERIVSVGHGGYSLLSLPQAEVYLRPYTVSSRRPRAEIPNKRGAALPHGCASLIVLRDAGRQRAMVSGARRGVTTLDQQQGQAQQQAAGNQP